MSEKFYHKSKLAIAMAAALGACGVNAASVVVKLDSVAYVSPPLNNSIDFSPLPQLGFMTPQPAFLRVAVF